MKIRTREYAGRAVETDSDGFLLDSSQWTPEIGEAIAREVGIWPLTEMHWSVLSFCREEAAREGQSPGLQRIAGNSGVARKTLNLLFPNGGSELAARIAGLRKPQESAHARKGRKETMKTAIKGLVAALVLGLLPAGAFATDGYFANGYGTPCKALAGACVALHLSAMSPAINPAAMAFMGKRYDLGLEYFNPNRDYSVVGSPSGYPGTFGLAPGTVTSDSRGFFIPSLSGSWKSGENGTLGLAIYGNGGMNTDYNAGTFGNVRTGVDLAQLFVAPTYAIKLGRGQAVGLTGLIAYQRFKAEGLQAFAPFSSDPEHLTNNGYDSSWGYGGRFGYLGEFSPYFSVGASYQTKLKMGKLKKYAGLFAEGGGFDVPATWTAGIAVRPVFPLTVTADVEQIFYSQVKSIGNEMMPNLMQARLGDTNGAGFCWHDTTTYKFGLQYAASQEWTLRAGYSHGNQPIDGSEALFNILAPGVIENHVAIGIGRLLPTGKEINLTVVRAFSKSVTGPNVLEAPGQQQIRLKMDQWEYEIGYSFGF